MSRRISVRFLSGGALAVLVALVAGCGGSGGRATAATPAPPTTSSGQAATVGVANTGLGQILVSSRGLTLYLFQADQGTKSACTRACANAWPPLLVQGKPTAGSGANSSLVGTTPRPEGTTQVTYNSHPLYTFAKDGKPGETNGQGVSAFGASWFAVNPAGTQVSEASASSSGTPGGVGY
jgi:predicted lipoprotein with Yx(FWY)xxD motif